MLSEHDWCDRRLRAQSFTPKQAGAACGSPTQETAYFYAGLAAAGILLQKNQSKICVLAWRNRLSRLSRQAASRLAFF
ncbi:MAG: hypothetical protein EPN57_15920 [Paraburkholderia sp.]|nr:MAG: hypothetical protein EPN57_15920 [Paraburkholderia sp.]